MEMHKPQFYGSTTVGAKGQIVLPAKLRKDFDITPGDKLLVLAHHTVIAPTVFLVKSKDLAEMLQKIFGNNYLDKISGTEELDKGNP